MFPSQILNCKFKIKGGNVNSYKIPTFKKNKIPTFINVA